MIKTEIPPKMTIYNSAYFGDNVSSWPITLTILLSLKSEKARFTIPTQTTDNIRHASLAITKHDVFFISCATVPRNYSSTPRIIALLRNNLSTSVSLYCHLALDKYHGNSSCSCRDRESSAP